MISKLPFIRLLISEKNYTLEFSSMSKFYTDHVTSSFSCLKTDRIRRAGCCRGLNQWALVTFGVEDDIEISWAIYCFDEKFIQTILLYQQYLQIRLNYKLIIQWSWNKVKAKENESEVNLICQQTESRVRIQNANLKQRQCWGQWNYQWWTDWHSQFGRQKWNQRWREAAATASETRLIPPDQLQQPEVRAGELGPGDPGAPGDHPPPVAAELPGLRAPGEHLGGQAAGPECVGQPSLCWGEGQGGEDGGHRWVHL